jgi:hypothetical protein
VNTTLCSLLALRANVQILVLDKADSWRAQYTASWQVASASYRMGASSTDQTQTDVAEMRTAELIFTAAFGLWMCLVDPVELQAQISIPQPPRIRFPPIPTIPNLPNRPFLDPPRIPMSFPMPLGSPFTRSTRQSSPMPEAPDPDALLIRPGELKYEPETRLNVRDDNGNTVVARYHVGVGDARIVIMPDGRLKSFPAEQTSETDRPFSPLSINQVRDKILADPQLKRFNFKTIQSRRFLYVYNTSEPFIRSTRTILETMYPAVRKYFQRTSVDTHEPEFPLVIMAFSTDDQYQEFRRVSTGMVAYYDAATNYVALYEQSRLNQVAPEIAIKNTISTIAHEGVHQILHNIGVQQRLSRWPMWLSEGLPEFFAPTSVAKGTRWAGLGATNVLRMHEIESEWKKQRSPLKL